LGKLADVGGIVKPTKEAAALGKTVVETGAGTIVAFLEGMISNKNTKTPNMHFLGGRSNAVPRLMGSHINRGMMGTAINIGRGFSSIAPVTERMIAVEEHASDLVGNSTVRMFDFGIEIRGIATSCIQSELSFITNGRAKKRGASQRSIFVNTNSSECVLFATKLCEEPTNDMNRRFLAGSTK
jgi:hypothetical protein